MNVCRCIAIFGFAAVGSLAASNICSADVLIALAAPLSGSEAAAGGQMKAGATKAVDDLNTRYGGVLGEKIVLQVTDDACDRKRAIAAANQLASQIPVLVLGHRCLLDSMTASAIYDKESILQISLDSTNVDFMQTSPTAGIFRICARDPAPGPTAGVGHVAGEFLASLTGKKVAVLSDGSLYGDALTADVVSAMKAHSRQPDINDKFIPGKGDYTSEVDSLKSDTIDFVYLGGRYPGLGEFANEIHVSMPSVIILAEDAIASKNYWARPENLAEDSRLATIPIDDLTYAAVQIWAGAVINASSFERDKVVSAINKFRFRTALGDITFKQQGDLNDAYYVAYQKVKSAAHRLTECQ